MAEVKHSYQIHLDEVDKISEYEFNSNKFFERKIMGELNKTKNFKKDNLKIFTCEYHSVADLFNKKYLLELKFLKPWNHNLNKGFIKFPLNKIYNYYSNFTCDKDDRNKGVQAWSGGKDGRDCECHNKIFDIINSDEFTFKNNYKKYIKMNYKERDFLYCVYIKKKLYYKDMELSKYKNFNSFYKAMFKQKNIDITDYDGNNTKKKKKKFLKINLKELKEKSILNYKIDKQLYIKLSICDECGLYNNQKACKQCNKSLYYNPSLSPQFSSDNEIIEEI